jgi:2-oxoglutarate ferredoxin oxidoreductase subunit delta
MREKKLVISAPWCKGCGICAAFCPKDALAIKDGKVTLKEDNECVLCGQCEQRCPDYAVYIEAAAEEVVQWAKQY